VKPDQEVGFLFTVLLESSVQPKIEKPELASLSMLFDVEKIESAQSSQIQHLMDDFDQSRERIDPQTIAESPKPKVDSINEALIKKLAEEHECGICYELLYQPVQLAPCLHIYCGGCLSDWFKKQQDCPNCRKEVKTVTKSFQALTMITMLLEMKPDL
jgi:hypothetical protein